MGQISFEFNDNSNGNMTAKHITLNEYMSRPYKALLECSVKKAKATSGTTTEFITNTSSYIGEKIYIKISQDCDNNVRTYRYVSGVVTDIIYKGLDKEDSSGNKYLYEVVVQPAFVQLMKNKRTKSYYGKTVEDIIKEILDENGITDYACDIDQNSSNYDLISRSNNIYIQQNNETDYDFLMRLLSYYGINYYFTHIPKEDSSKDGVATLTFTTKMPDVKFMSVGADNIGINTLSDTLGVNTDRNIGTFEDNIVVRYSDATVDVDKNALSLYGFEYGNISDGLIQEGKDKSEVAKNLKASLSYMKSQIKLSSSYTTIGVNSKIRINGHLPNAAEENNEMYLIKSVTYVEHDVHDKDLIEIDGFFLDKDIEGAGIIYYDIENMASSYFSSNYIGVSAPISSPTFNLQNMLLEGIVCDSEGNITVSSSDTYSVAVPTLCDAYNPMQFYAKINGSVQIVRMVLPYGSKKYSGFMYPEIGTKIIVSVIGGKYYLYGYVPDIGNVVSTNGSAYNGSVFLGSSDMYLNLAQEGEDVITKAIYNGTIDSLMDEVCSYVNLKYIEKQYYSATSSYSVKDVNDSYTIQKWCETLKEAYDEEIATRQSAYDEIISNNNNTELSDTDRDEKNKELNSAIATYNNNIRTIESEIAQAKVKIEAIFTKAKSIIGSTTQADIIDRYIESLSRLNIYGQALDINSTGSVDIKGNERLHLYSDNTGIEISAEDGSIILKADESIKLSVGRSSIEIGDAGITLTSRVFNTSSGPIDSSLELNALSGASLSGFTCSIEGLTTVKLEDSFGGEFKVFAGGTSMSGFGTSISTNNGLKAFSNISSAYEIGNQLFSAIDSNNGLENSEVAAYFADTSSPVTDAGIAITDLISSNGSLANSFASGNLKETLYALLDALFDILDGIADVMESELGGESVAVKALRGVILGLKFIYAVVVFALACTETELVFASKIELEGGKISMVAKSRDSYTVEDEEGNSILAGLNTETEEEEGDEPDNEGDESDNEGDEPDNEGDEPDNEGDEPDGNGDNPDGNGDNPDGNGDNPDGNGDNPDGNGDNPDGNGDNPSGANEETPGSGNNENNPGSGSENETPSSSNNSNEPTGSSATNNNNSGNAGNNSTGNTGTNNSTGNAGTNNSTGTNK